MALHGQLAVTLECIGQESPRQTSVAGMAPVEQHPAIEAAGVEALEGHRHLLSETQGLFKVARRLFPLLPARGGHTGQRRVEAQVRSSHQTARVERACGDGV